LNNKGVYTGYFFTRYFSSGFPTSGLKSTPGEVTLDKQMLRLITELDGKKNFRTIARNIDIELGEIKEIV
jgi:hypothetical protein